MKYIKSFENNIPKITSKYIVIKSNREDIPYYILTVPDYKNENNAKYFYYSKYDDGILKDGNFSFLDDNHNDYIFYGYSNLNKKQIKEIKQIKKEIEINNNTNKYNL